MERGKTLGTPLALVRNRNTKQEDYQFDEKEYLPFRFYIFLEIWNTASLEEEDHLRETIARVIGGA